ncbi:VIT and vWA domain-containing protein [Prosthecobacter vanneervenii]|uniref:Ca-activated chloride channel family protein n=1 Tax=Prosthecobacter vanneervenii TaxID=48466 RepID=A0A7W7YEZ2_9BACT|nr:VIT and VWA domain-containing protein [Prosthecobacter vanneervenii]MBB5034854.1 Ca-activated chloride channel family protein [Prosthecobacter vanneervenii]
MKPILALLLLATPLLAQTSRALSWISPNTRIIHAQPVQVTQVEARIDIADQLAITTLDIALRNPTSRPQESELLVPVPSGAVLKSFAFEGGNSEGTAKLLPREEARRIYDTIVAQTRDPALLEFVGHSVVKSSVFPVPANGTQKVRVTYEQLLEADGARLDYVLPRSEAVEYTVPWKLSMRVKSTSRIASVYSPSHEISTKQPDEHTATLSCETKDPGAFRVSLLREAKDEMTASLLAYPDPKIGGGYFLVMIAPPKPRADAKPILREVTLVIDRSGSMAGPKLDQVKAAALQVIEGLNDGEGFNLIVYNEAVEMFAAQPVVKNATTTQQARDYISALRVSGGTNIHDSVVEALRQKPLEGMLPLVLFLTDGLPTIGQTSEKAIREAVAKGNPHQRRVFTFGVGVDVNTPLLARIARETRASAEFVLPKEDVEVKVGRVFERLRGPLLTRPIVQVVDDPNRVSDLIPSPLPDVFEGEQILLSGTYRGDAPLHFQLHGDAAEGKRKFDFTFNLDKASTANAFVARLWASSKIAVLSEAIRDLGADGATGSTTELVNEIVRLSTQFGILTEYTAFLAEEGTTLAAAPANASKAAFNYNDRAMKVRSGPAAVSQQDNLKKGVESKQLNIRNRFLNDKMQAVEITSVQQCQGGALFNKGNRWTDSGAAKADRAPDRTIEIGSPEFGRLVDELAADNRQSLLALRGELLLQHRGQLVLIR